MGYVTRKYNRRFPSKKQRYVVDSRDSGRRLVGPRGNLRKRMSQPVSASGSQPPVPRVHKKYWSTRLGNTAEAKYLDRAHKKRYQQAMKNRGWTSSGTIGNIRGKRGGTGSQDIQSGSLGRGGFTRTLMPYKDLCDAMFPILRERKESRTGTLGTLTSGVGVQVVDNNAYFTRADIRAWYTKSSDAQNIANVTALNSGTNFDWVFMYLGGQVTYMFTNTCSHTIQIECMQIQSKRYQSIDPQTRWTTDLGEDNTLLNVQTPTNVEATINTLNYRPGKGKSSQFRDWYQILGTKRYTLEPGQTVYHTVKFAPFKITGKQLNTDTSAGVIPTILPKTQYTMFIQRGLGLVCDSGSAQVGIGSSVSVGTRVERHQYRAMFQYKGMQTYNTTTLGAFIGGEQEFNPETEGLDAVMTSTT